jgi:CelD/BcsL family acetyltransferase involved in cellulose biosynthesis
MGADSNGLSKRFRYIHDEGGRPLKSDREWLLPNDLLMPVASAFVTAEPCASPVVAVRGENMRQADVREASSAIADAIAVERASGERLSEIESDWHELIGRAHEANAFMHPVILAAAQRQLRDRRCVTLLAWRRDRGEESLVGLWAFSIGKPWHAVLPLHALMAPSVPHAYLATPVIDRAHADAALNAMLEFIAGDDSLPNLVSLDPIAMGGPTMQALTRVLTARASRPCIVAQSQRPTLVSDLDGKLYLEQALSSSSRKKLRQHRRRLEEKGALESRICNTPETAAHAFDEFLTLEAAGWKGSQGTALLCRETEAAFARDMFSAMAQRGEAAVHALYLADKPVSMQLVLRAGSAAFTWKTAYDEAFSNFSPGMLLLEDYTKAFLSDDSIAHVDSCAYDESGFMSVWTERQAIAQVWFDARPCEPVSFLVISRLHKAYLRLRALAKQAYLSGRSKWKRH